MLAGRAAGGVELAGCAFPVPEIGFEDEFADEFGDDMSDEYNRASSVAARLAAGLASASGLVLDGAMGTELERRGLHAALPLWSAHALLHAPETVRAIHAEYAAAGAQILTANTFRTQGRTLAREGMAERADELTGLAVRLAREGAGTREDVLIAGSAPTLEDCYRPDLVPSDAELEREHGAHADALAAGGADLILIETMNTVREARSAARAARSTGLPFFASFVCGTGGRLLSGEPLADALDALRRESPVCLLVNCLPPSAVAACLPALRGTSEAFGVYANLGEPRESGRSEDCTPEQFAAHAATWRDAGARVIGGCCGTEPAHICALVGLANSAATQS